MVIAANLQNCQIHCLSQQMIIEVYFYQAHHSVRYKFFYRHFCQRLCKLPRFYMPQLLQFLPRLNSSSYKRNPQYHCLVCSPVFNATIHNGSYWQCQSRKLLKNINIICTLFRVLRVDQYRYLSWVDSSTGYWLWTERRILFHDPLMHHVVMPDGLFSVEFYFVWLKFKIVREKRWNNSI